MLSRAAYRAERQQPDYRIRYAWTENYYGGAFSEYDMQPIRRRGPQ